MSAYRETSVIFAEAGEYIGDVAVRAIVAARKAGREVEFEHNGVRVSAHMNSRVDDLFIIWSLRRALLQSGGAA